MHRKHLHQSAQPDDAHWQFSPPLSATALLLLLVAFPFAAAARPPAEIVVGTLTLTHCNDDYNGYCGSIERPLDPVTGSPGTITVGFEYYPRFDRARASLGTILPQEGGPGYSSTGTRDAFVTLFTPLRDRRDILIVDKRGTGLSTPIDCPSLQEAKDAQTLAECGQQLGKTAWYYGSALAAADVVAVLDALKIDRVDYYGDSYGTYFGQTMASRFPGRLRSIVLDGAYPARPKDPWFATDWATARDGFDLVLSAITLVPETRSPLHRADNAAAGIAARADDQRQGTRRKWRTAGNHAGRPDAVHRDVQCRQLSAGVSRSGRRDARLV